MTLVTTSTSKNVFGFAWSGGTLLRTHYSYPCVRTVSSTRGERPHRNTVNPFDVVKTKITFEQEGRYYDPKTQGMTYGPSIGLVGLVDMYSGGLPRPSYNFDNGAVKALAIQKAFASASQPYFAEMHQLGELAETITALKSPMSGIRKLFNSTFEMTSKAKKLRLPIKDVAGAYLENLFGTMPAIAQAGTLGTTAARMLDKKFPTYKTFRGGKQSTTVEGTLEAGVFIDGLNRPIFNHRSCVYDIRSSTYKRCSAGIVVSNPRLRNSNNLGAVAAEGWELLPLSFLANMFVDLSSLLKECRPIPGRVEGSWATSIVDSTYQYTMKEVTGLITEKPCIFTIHKTWIHRDVGITRTGMLHLGPGLNSIGKMVSTLALGISFKK